MTRDEAEAWCRENQAVVKFIEVVGVSRVQVSTGGHPCLSERYTFLEAVETAAEALTRRRAARGSPSEVLARGGEG